MISRIVVIYLVTMSLFYGCAAISPKDDLPFDLRVPQTDVDHLLWITFNAPNSEAAKTIVKDRAQILDQLAQAEPDPYGGNRSYDSPCQKDPPPKAQTGSDQNGSWNIHWLHASATKVLGVCTNIDAALKVQYLILNCPKNKSVFMIRYFSDPTSKWELSPVARCR